MRFAAFRENRLDDKTRVRRSHVVVRRFGILLLLSLSGCSKSSPIDENSSAAQLSQAELTAEAQAHFGSDFAGVITEGGRTVVLVARLPSSNAEFRGFTVRSVRYSTQELEDARDRLGQQMQTLFKNDRILVITAAVDLNTNSVRAGTTGDLPLIQARLEELLGVDVTVFDEGPEPVATLDQ